jgi:hypothetical protein
MSRAEVAALGVQLLLVFFNLSVLRSMCASGPMTRAWNGFSPIYTEAEYCVHISRWDYRGDANGDGIVNVGDVVHLIAFLYRGVPASVPRCCDPQAILDRVEERQDQKPPAKCRGLLSLLPPCSILCGE